MKSLALIVTCVLILHLLNPSDGIFHTGKQLLNVTSYLEGLQKSDHPCGPPEVLIPMLKGQDPVKPSQLGLMMVYMDQLTDITDLPDLNSIFDSLQSLLSDVMRPYELSFYTAWKSRLEVYLSTINALYDRFKALWKDEGPINVDDWMALATDIEETMPSNLTAFRADLLNSKNLYEGDLYLTGLVHWSTKGLPDRCTVAFAMNGAFNQLSNLVFITQLKATVPQIFASLLRNCNGPARKDNLNRLAIEHRHGYLEIVRGMKNTLSFLPESWWPCVPFGAELISGQDYYELETSEHLSVVQFSDADGFENCLSAQEAQLMTYKSPSDVCNGTLYDCDYAERLDVYRLVNNDKWGWWVQASRKNDKNIFENCMDGYDHYYLRENNFAIHHCVCKCGENLNQIDVSPVLTNYSADMVVTGFRFVLKNGILHLQAQQGKLLPGERIDPASVEWIPLPKNPKLVPLNSKNSKFHIGDVMAKMGDVPVGISFVESDNKFYLQMYAISYEFNKGISGTCINEVLPPNRDDPYKYVTFELSNRADRNRKPVLPLVHVGAAATDPPALLGGFGIKYDARLWALISPEIKGFDYSDIFEKIKNKAL